MKAFPSFLFFASMLLAGALGLWSVRLHRAGQERTSTSGQSAGKNRSGQACGKSSASGGQERRSGFS